LSVEKAKKGVVLIYIAYMLINSKCKICRREGKKLFLKGERCYSSKCALVKRKYPPGAHGQKGYPRLSDYGRQLREKQSLRRSYYLSEKKFKTYFEKAKKRTGNTEENFLKLLEQRLDNVVYRSGLVDSRRAAQQIVSHGNILVNNRKVNIPSYQVKIGDEIKVKEKKSIINQVKERMEGNKKEGVLPPWLSLDSKKYEIKIIQEPEVKDLLKEHEMELIVGYYSR
jgi:small subunit ribosomal protein S4